MKKGIYVLMLLALTFIFATSCEKDEAVKDDEGKENNEGALSYDFTLDENEEGWRCVVDGETYGGSISIVNSLNKEYFIPLGLVASAKYGGIDWLPKKEGTFRTGEKLSDIAGSATGDAYFSMSVIIDGLQYYAYSSNAYGTREEDRVYDTEATVTITKFDGDYIPYTLVGMNLNSFIGEVDLLFEGTFKTKDGSKTIEVTRGEVRVRKELPPSAKLIE